MKKLVQNNQVNDNYDEMIQLYDIVTRNMR